MSLRAITRAVQMFATMATETTAAANSDRLLTIGTPLGGAQRG